MQEYSEKKFKKISLDISAYINHIVAIFAILTSELVSTTVYISHPIFFTLNYAHTSRLLSTRFGGFKAATTINTSTTTTLVMTIIAVLVNDMMVSNITSHTDHS